MTYPEYKLDALPTCEAAEYGADDDLPELGDPQYAASTYGDALDIDQQTRTAITESRCIDAREAQDMAAAIGTLPQPGEALHMIIGGQHSQWHLIPAVLQLANPATIVEATIATLTYSKQNYIDLCHLIDARKIQKLTVVCSHYFSKTSPHIYDPSKILFDERGVILLSPRSHAKLVLLKLSDGRAITAEGSANLRSAVTVEQVTLYADTAVYEFHDRWIKALPRSGAKQ